MRNKWGVFIHCEKEGKHYHQYLECQDMVSVARVLITFKPRQGWEVVSIEVKEAEQLELELFDVKRWWD
jgi:hypothetical protein